MTLILSIKIHVFRKSEIYSKERFKDEENLNDLQCVKNICRKKDKVLKKERKRVVGYGGTHL